MGAGASLIDKLPERIDKESYIHLSNSLGYPGAIDLVRFDLLKDENGTISKCDALKIAEKKMPPIYSINCLNLDTTLIIRK